MPTLAEVAKSMANRAERSVGSLIGTYTVATTSPFEVYLNGSATAVPAYKVDGLSYTVGASGFFIKKPGGQKPLCIPTA